MNSRYPGIFLLLVLLSPLLVTYSFFSWQQNLIRGEVRELIAKGLDKHELLLLGFKKNDQRPDLRWEHDLEFEFRGEMYDITDSYSTSDSIYYWCFPDTKESRLKAKFSCLIDKAAGNHPFNTHQQKQLRNFFHLTFLPVAFAESDRAILATTRLFNPEFPVPDGYIPEPIPPPPQTF